MASKTEDLDAMERRRRFKAAVQENGHKMASLARAAGLPNANVLYNFANGFSNNLDLETWKKLAPHLPKSDLNYLIGIEVSKGRPLCDVPPSQRVSDRQRQRAFQQSANSVDEIRSAVTKMHAALSTCSQHIAMLEARLMDLAD